MFKIAQSPAYFAPVSVKLPGESLSQTFDAQFKRLEQSAVADLVKRTQSGELDDAGMVAEVMVGWRGVSDESGAELEFNHGNLIRVLSIYPVAASVVKSYFESLSGAREKN